MVRLRFWHWLVVGALVSPTATAVAELQAHRAFYRLALSEGHASSGVTDAMGGLVVEYQPDCEGWQSRQRLGFVADTEEGSNFSYDVISTNWESHDHKHLRFTIEYYQGDEKLEEYRGEASVTESNGGIAEFEVPETEQLTLPAGTEFPTAHVKTLIDAAEAGEFFVARDIFTGSGPDPLMTVTAVIGKEVKATDDRVRGWPVRLAFFSTEENGDEVPVTEIGYFLGSDGVLDDVIIDYGDFVLEGQRARLERLDYPDCD